MNAGFRRVALSLPNARQYAFFARAIIGHVCELL